MSIFDTTLHIPAEQRPFVPPRSLTRVTLPLVARMGPRFAVAAVAALCMSLACFALSAVLAGADDASLSKYGLSAFFAAAAILPAAVAVTAFLDALRGRAVLTVDPQGIRDTRLREGLIAWERVGAAEIVGAAQGIAAVRLTLVEEGAPRYNPFRIGGWSVAWNRRRRDRLVAVSLLDRRPHDLAHTILMLAGRHGATVAREAPLTGL